MSCNGCRVLRKGCSNTCILRPCLQWIDSPESQAHATIFVAKFFGRAALMSFISAVPQSQRPALFQSLLYEACGRTVNPVNGAVGLMASGYWHLCQSAVDTVLKGGKLLPLPDLGHGQSSPDGSEVSFQPVLKRKRTSDQDVMNSAAAAADDDDLNLSLRVSCGSPSMESGMTTNTGSYFGNGRAEAKLLNLF